MRNFLKSLQVTLKLNEDERVLLANMLNYVLVSTILIVLIILPFTYELVINSPLRSALAVSVFIANLIGWLLLRRGYLIPTSAWLVISYWTITLVLVIDTGGVESPWIVVQVAVTVLAGLLLGGFGGLFLAGLTLITDWLIYQLLSAQAILPDALVLSPLDRWLALFASFALVALAILFAGSLAQNNMRRSHENERLYRSLFDKTNDGVITVGLDYKIVAANQTAADYLGYQVQELVGKPYEQLVPPEEVASVHANFAKLAEEGMTPLFERTLIRKDGSRFKVEFNATTIRDERGKLLYFQGVARDVTERKRLEEQLRYALDEMETLAMQDPLTGLLNRRAMTDHAEAEWHRAQREGKPLCVVLVDMDNLKRVNDVKGHDTGDRVIQELAKTITSSKRPYDWAGRWGGDEFLLLLPGANLMEARDVAERLRIKYTDMDWIRELGGDAMVSLGIACFSGRKGDETSLDRLVAQADKALYQAKAQGRNRVEVYRDLLE